MERYKEANKNTDTGSVNVDTVNEIDYSEDNEGNYHMDIDGKKLGLKYLGHHHNSDGTVTIKCSYEEPKKDLTSDTFEVSL